MVTSRTGTAKYLRNRRTVLREAKAAGLTHCPGFVDDRGRHHACGAQLDYRTRAEFDRQEPERAGDERPDAAEADHIIEVKHGGTDDVDNLRVLCRRCNRQRNQAAGAPDRLVVILCGPPGAGKTTAAHANPFGLTVYDRDDPQWAGESAFTAALRGVGRNPHARAVVIRSGASSTARATAARITDATHTYMLDASDAELRQRLAGRGRADVAGTIRGVTRWRQQHDRDDSVADFPGWHEVSPAGPIAALDPWPLSRSW